MPSTGATATAAVVKVPGAFSLVEKKHVAWFAVRWPSYLAPALFERPAGAARSPQSCLRVDTINPPGNEAASVHFFKKVFDAEGISYDTAESAPSRGNIWGRLEGGDQPALMLLHHMDVVPANTASWLADPLSGEIKDGYVYGHGALETTSSGILHLAAFAALHRSKTPLNRDVTVMATADEEAGGVLNVGWLVKKRPELFERGVCQQRSR